LPSVDSSFQIVGEASSHIFLACARGRATKRGGL
jgi:hypothetical protein